MQVKCSWFVKNPEKSLLVETLEPAHSLNQESKTLEYAFIETFKNPLHFFQKSRPAFALN